MTEYVETKRIHKERDMARRPSASRNGRVSGVDNPSELANPSVFGNSDVLLGNEASPGRTSTNNPPGIADIPLDDFVFLQGQGSDSLDVPVPENRGGATSATSIDMGNEIGNSAQIAVLGLTLEGVDDISAIVPRYPRVDLALTQAIQELREIIETAGNIQVRMRFILVMVSLAEAKAAADALDRALSQADLTDRERQQIVQRSLLIAQDALNQERIALRQERILEQEGMADETAQMGMVPPQDLTLDSLNTCMNQTMPPLESVAASYEVYDVARLLPPLEGADAQEERKKVLAVGAKSNKVEQFIEAIAPLIIGVLIAIAFGVMIGLASPNSIRSGRVPLPIMVGLTLAGMVTASMLGRAAQGAIRNLVLALPLKERFANRVLIGVVTLLFMGVFVGLGAETVIEGGALHELYLRFVDQKIALQGGAPKPVDTRASAALFYLMGACISLPYVIFKCNKAMQEALIGVNWARLYFVRLWDQRMSRAAMVVKRVLRVGELRTEEADVMARIVAIRDRLEHLASEHTVEHIMEVKAERLYAARTWLAFQERLDLFVETWDVDGYDNSSGRVASGRNRVGNHTPSTGETIMAALRRLFGGNQ